MNTSKYFQYVRAFLLQGTVRRKLSGLLASNQGVFLTYHRILPPHLLTTCVEPGMYVTPTTLKAHIRFLKKYFNIVSISQAESLLERASPKKIDAKPYCVITFDDGWYDFYTYAWPVLQNEEVPATVFLPTGLIGSNEMFWTDRLALIVSESGLQTVIRSQDVHKEWRSVVRATSFQKKLAGAIEILKQYPYQTIKELLDECEKKSGISHNFYGRTFMNWDEVRELFSSGQITFGSHTANHAILTTLSHDEAHMELQTSKKKLLIEKVVSTHVPFCYPNGNYNENISRLVEQTGYSSAVSCDSGWNESTANLFHLKRISLHQDISCTSSILSYRLVKYC